MIGNRVATNEVELPLLLSREKTFSADARLRAIVDEHYDFIWRTLRRLGVREADVEDGTQQVLMVMARRLQDISSETERSFLFGTALRVASEFRRKASRSREVGDDRAIESEQTQQPNAETLLDQKRARRLLDGILREMSDDLRAVFVLFEFEEMTMSAIASMLEVPIGTVASRLRRSRDIYTAASLKLRMTSLP
ncbi:MAG: hypothetical protein NVS3B20_27300 [Polyangiales bacterium]